MKDHTDGLEEAGAVDVSAPADCDRATLNERRLHRAIRGRAATTAYPDLKPSALF
jgi:hypothetical protein